MFYNIPKYRNAALSKIRRLMPQCPNTEFIVIALPNTSNPFPANQHPRGAATQVRNALRDRPTRAPYVGQWTTLQYSSLLWYRVSWNHYIPLRCGARINLNDVLDQLVD